MIQLLWNREIATGYSGNYVHVYTKPKGCYAYVGMINRGGQELNLQDGGCFSARYSSNKFSLSLIQQNVLSSLSTIVHEFVHALGAFHVHSRSDRDKYVTVDFSNIKKGKEHNFKKHANCPTYGTPYDPMSLMHYEHYAFAIDRKKSTIYSKVSIKNFYLKCFLLYSNNSSLFSLRCLAYQQTNLELLNNLEMLT